MDFQITPTIMWAIFGIVLSVAELISFSFVLIFFGIAAFLVAALRLVGLDHLVSEIFIFAFLSVAGIFMFRSRLVGLKSKDVSLNDVNQRVTLSSAIPQGKSARITYQGSSWTAHNMAARDLRQDEVVVIEKVDGINLYVNTINN